MQPRLNLIVIRANDLPRAERFYRCLGVDFVEEQHGSGPVHLAARLGDDLVFEIYPASDSSTLATRFGFRVKSVDAVLAQVVAEGGAIISSGKQGQWGYRAVVADPDGHRVELVEA